MKKIPDPKKMRRVKGPLLSRTSGTSLKVRITTYLDEDILQELKNLSLQTGGKYQTLLNQLLRETLSHHSGVLSRLKRLEKAVFKSNSTQLD